MKRALFATILLALETAMGASWPKVGPNYQPPKANVPNSYHQQAGAGTNTAFDGFTATQNAALTPADFNSFCVTAPANAQLPGGGAYPICGLYDVTPAKLITARPE